MTLTPLKRAFLALEEAEARLAALQQEARESIAIIGLGCRLPGGASSPDAFWELMRTGRDAVSRIPADRWDADAYFDPDPSVPGRVATREGGFISDVDRFDPAFFGIAPREARAMDPQQRLFLEVAWEALEHAGQAPDRLERSATGVYVGVCSSDYTYLQLETLDPGILDAHFTSGIAHSVVSGRLSYLLGLQGPSLTIDTACSSSLVAVHLACQALRARDCRMALAGGVNLMLSPDLYVALSHSRMLAPDGRCKTFDAAADGFGRGEGCGVVVLKRLSDAVANGDRVLAVIRGSAVNQDGPSSGLTAPNGPAQAAVIREALDRAGVVPRQVGFIEAHGTGTQLGDPLEVQALGAVFGADRDASRPLVLGSVKTNIGHVEAAAGVAGLIKVVLALANRQIPAHLHFKTPSPHIAWNELPLQVPTALSDWEPIDGRRIAGVSSFGFSGTNAHIVLEEAPDTSGAPGSNASALPATARPAQLFTVSARDERALTELVARHTAALDGDAEPDLADVCFTANAGRAHFDYRATVIAHSTSELRARLAAGVTPVKLAHRDPPTIAFLFTGQGAQYSGMAQALDAAAPVFRQALDRCADVLAPHLQRPLRTVLTEADNQLDDTTYTQPALFVVEYALAELLESWGITPKVVMGHSVGEYVAACRAGVLSLEDALRVVAARGRLMGSLPPGGGMAAIAAAESRVAAALAGLGDRVAIGAVNGPEQTVISGDLTAVAGICRQFEAQGIRCHTLPVSHAFHSPLVEPILDAFEREVRATRFASPRLRLISNLTGALVDPDAVTQATYWRRHVREAVRFHDGIRTLLAMRPDCIVEVGPHPTLLALARTVAGDSGPCLVPTLRKGRSDWEQLLETLAALYVRGAEIEWRGVAAGGSRRVVDLPTYPFQRERCWFDAKPQSQSARWSGSGGHPLLGMRVRCAGADTLFESRVRADAPGFVRDHRVLGRVVLPATGYLETLFAAASAALSSAVTDVEVENVTVKEAMLLDDEGPGRILQAVIAPAVGDGSRTATLCSVADGSSDDEPWVEHVTATLRRSSGVSAGIGGHALDEARGRCSEAVSVTELYSVISRRGVQFGDAFRVVRQLWRGETDAVADVELTAGLTADVSRFHVHPVLLDGCLQVMATLFADDGLYLPIGVARCRILRLLGPRAWSHVSMPARSGETRRADIRVFTPDGLLALELEGVQLKRVSRDALERLGDRWLDSALYQPGWRPARLGDLVPVETLAAVGREVIPRLSSSAGMAAYDAFLPRLDARCQGYVNRALRELGWSADNGIDPARYGVLPRHHRLFTRLLEIAAEGGPSEGDGPLSAVPPGAEAELELTDRVARELAGAMRGERDPMQLLFPGGSLATTERIYRDSPTAHVFGGLIAEVLAAAAEAATPGRRLRVLEVGAGTGGTTAHVLRRLADAAIEYTFTDVGPLFVARARERFAAYPCVSYATFDLERDADAQGLTAGDYDVVIASNVIHATADLRRTLARVRRLLVPNGLLVMLEVTAPQRWFDLTVGLTDGWWAYTDHDLRANYPTLARQRWLTLLAEEGFTAAALPDAPQAGALALQSLFLARSQPARRTWWLVPDRGGVAESLAGRLRARGDRCTVGDQLAPGETVDGVVYARALDGKEVAADALRVTQSTLTIAPVPRLWFLTRGGQECSGTESALQPQEATLWGFRRSVAIEHPELRCVAVDLDPDGEDVVDSVLQELDAPGDEPEVSLRADGRHVARLRLIRRASHQPQRGAMRLTPHTRGSLDGLTLETFTPARPGPGEVAIAVDATGLNFKDVLNVLGMYPGDPGPLGGECAGTVTAVGADVTHVAVGDEVMAVAGGSFATHVVARAELVQRRPAGMNADEGASIPIAFLTAQFCLGHLAALRAGERVLIHAAAGGVGMAAVRLAQQAGAEIYATAGTVWKRDLLRTMGVTHIFDSRSDLFAEDILAATGGRGVDVVLNSLAGDMLDASFRVLAPDARFIEIGKRGIKEPAWVAAHRPDVAYHIVDWGVTAAEDPRLIGGMFAQLCDRFRAGTIAPLPRHTFTIDQASRAFRFMAQARHAGKVVVRYAPPSMPAIRRDGTYLITGGLAGLGLVVARWLAERGAGRIVLVSRRGVTTDNATAIEAVRALGATVVAEALDVTDEAALRALLDRVRRQGPPLRGVIHSAGVLDDASVLHQSAARFDDVLAPKVRGAELLDALTRGDALDHFVMFASVAGVLGSAGQANHAAANAYLDVLARARRSLGLPGLSIDWSAWTEVGAAAGIVDRLAAQGIGAVTPAQGLVALEQLMASDHAQAMVLPVDWPRYLRGRSTPAFLSELAVAPKTTAPVAAAAPKADLLSQLAEMPPGRWRPTIAAFVREAALKSLGLDSSRAIDPRTPLGELGLDSLLAVELRNTLATSLGRSFPATLLFDYPTIDALTDFVFAEIRGADGEPEPVPAPSGDMVDAIEDMSDDEVERQLAARAARSNL